MHHLFIAAAAANAALPRSAAFAQAGLLVGGR